MNIEKTVLLGTLSGTAPTEVVCRIEFKDGRLAISGIAGGDAADLKADDIRPAAGWDREMVERFLSVWRTWHLNNMRAGSPAQTEALREMPAISSGGDFYAAASAFLAARGLNPDPGYLHNGEPYRYGSAWLKQEVPEDVFRWLADLPAVDAADHSPREALLRKMESLGLTVESTFVPWSQSRNKGEKDRSLNWRVTLKHKGRVVLETDYTAGIASCPSYRHGDRSAAQVEAIRFETENGKPKTRARGEGPIVPDAVGVVYSLCSDADAIDAGGFEAWASDFGYDTDSRKAEATYRACVDTGLKLRAALGDQGLQELRALANEL